MNFEFAIQIELFAPHCLIDVQERVMQVESDLNKVFSYDLDNQNKSK